MDFGLTGRYGSCGISVAFTENQGSPVGGWSGWVATVDCTGVGTVYVESFVVD